jgi:SAM-dependent methyltransferase
MKRRLSKRGLMRIDDRERVKSEYATEDRFLARRLVSWAELDGPNVEDEAIAAVREVSPRRVLDAGCGTGELARRLELELGSGLVALDLSPRMVELARARGLDARVGDLQALSCDDASFDCVLANRVLYHLPDLVGGLAEIARVLRPGGRLVAITYSGEHLLELWSLLGVESPIASTTFTSENGEAALQGHFVRIERRDVSGRARFPAQAAIRGYLAAYERLTDAAWVARLPDVPTPFVATYRHSVFVAAKAEQNAR